MGIGARLTVNPAGGSGDIEGRSGWCTPKWLAALLGGFNLDPCSNSRSHIQAAKSLSLENGDNGLDEAIIKRVWSSTEVFVNPPYGQGQVIRWVKHYAHTNFTFLLRWDPSTEWFAELLPQCEIVWFPKQRINFEPPPGVKSSSNPFPHALYFKDTPKGERYANLADRGYFMLVH